MHPSTRRRRAFPSTLCIRILLTLVLASVVSEANAASQVYADTGGLCNGATPCFTTIQEAVENAGPGPSTVDVFPGLYAESVDLSAMGAALVGGGEDDLTLQAVDALGQPATSGVTIDPDGPGGPGTGYAIFSGLGDEFEGAVVLRGMMLHSPDLPCFVLATTGDLVVDHAVLSGCGDSGGAAFTQGTLTYSNIVSVLNAGAGILGLGSGVVVEDVLAERNDGSGVLAGSSSTLRIERVTATANGETGIEARACTSLEAEDLLGNLNGTGGVFLLAGLEDCSGLVLPMTAGPAIRSLSMEARVEGLRRRSSLFSILERFRSRVGSRKVDSLPRNATAAAAVTVTGIRGNDNGTLGIALESETGAILLDGAEARDNVESGLGAIGPILELRGGTFLRNENGALFFVDSLLAEQIVASDNAPPGFTPPDRGVGLRIFSITSSLDDVVAERNAYAGLTYFTGEAPFPLPSGITHSLSSSRFVDNQIGVLTLGDGVASLTAIDVEASGNSATGFSLPNLWNGLLQRITALGGVRGLAVNVSESLQVLESEISTNTLGVTLAVQPDAEARINCSNIRNNASTGLELLAGDAADARANFWGAPSGPTHPGNPGGTGDTVVDGANSGSGVVDYSDFLTTEASSSDCPAPISVLEIPTTGGPALILLALLLGGAAVLALRGS